MTAVPVPKRELDPAADLPPDAPEPVRDAARGKEPKTTGDEIAAIEFLLGPQQTTVWDCDVLYETPKGTATLKWRVESMRGEDIEKHERECLDMVDGVQRMNERRLSAELVAAATVFVKDMTGRQTKPTDEDFRRTPSGDINPSAADALRGRFERQEGILYYLAQEIRRISGWSPDRVGNAQRVLVNVTGNS
jgi:hypothetical protein